jgi:hypothetical protein
MPKNRREGKVKKVKKKEEGRGNSKNKKKEGWRIREQEVLGKINRLLFFDTTWTARETKKLGARTHTHTRARRQQGDLISLLTKLGGGGYRQKGNLISLKILKG